MILMKLKKWFGLFEDDYSKQLPFSQFVQCRHCLATVAHDIECQACGMALDSYSN